VVMDHGWIVTLADPQRPEVQLSIMTHDATAPVVPVISVTVDDVDASYRAAVAAGAEIVHELPRKRGVCGDSSSATRMVTWSTRGPGCRTP